MVTPSNMMTDPTKQYEFPAMDTDLVEDLDVPPVRTKERIDWDLAPFPDTTVINDKPAPVTESTPMELLLEHEALNNLILLDRQDTTDETSDNALEIL
ncbi:unnamed protein product [Arabis nemorensis]|uniref:Uncharacterized protein n=1 Tax=Arabis nemorensis TaxID=586526 RepID=A0A565BCF3_9BRAS|nr:unnamed protein product [Arabis nemorensis]